MIKTGRVENNIRQKLALHTKHNNKKLRLSKVYYNNNNWIKHDYRTDIKKWTR